MHIWCFSFRTLLLFPGVNTKKHSSSTHWRKWIPYYRTVNCKIKCLQGFLLCCVHPLYIYSSGPYASPQESDLESGLIVCKNHNIWISTCALRHLWLLCFPDINCPFKSCQPGSTGLVNPMTIRRELTVQAHLGLFFFQSWKGDAESGFLLELQIQHWFKKVV